MSRNSLIMVMCMLLGLIPDWRSINRANCHSAVSRPLTHIRVNGVFLITCLFTGTRSLPVLRSVSRWPRGLLYTHNTHWYSAVCQALAPIHSRFNAGLLDCINIHLVTAHWRSSGVGGAGAQSPPTWLGATGFTPRHRLQPRAGF